MEPIPLELTGTGSIVIASTKTLTTVVNGTTSFDGVISGAGNLTKSGTATLTLSGTNTYSGKTSIAQGTLSISSDSNLGTAPGSYVSDQLTIANTMTLSLADGVIINANRGISLGLVGNITNTGTGTILSVISGTGLTKSGTGTLILSGANTYTGQTTISAGTLALTGSGTIQTSSLVQVDGTLNISGVTTSADYGQKTGSQIKRLTGSGSVVLGNRRLEITAAVDDEFSGIISSSALNDLDDPYVINPGITIVTGTQTLSGENTYYGYTEIDSVPCAILVLPE